MEGKIRDLFGFWDMEDLVTCWPGLCVWFLAVPLKSRVWNLEDKAWPEHAFADHVPCRDPMVYWLREIRKPGRSDIVCW